MRAADRSSRAGLGSEVSDFRVLGSGFRAQRSGFRGQGAEFPPRRADGGKFPVSGFRFRFTGFTLIEVLAAMTVLAIILMLMGEVFSGSTMAWESGTRRMDQNISARAVLDLIQRDVAGAIAIKVDAGDASPYGGANTSLRVLTLAETPDATNMEGRIVRYYTSSTNNNGKTIYLLRRDLVTDAGTVHSAYASGDPTGSGSPGTVAENIAAFEVYTNTVAGTTNQLPSYVDIFLSMLSAADAQRASVAAGGQAAFVERHEKRYTTRIYLHNQKGYSTGY